MKQTSILIFVIINLFCTITNAQKIALTVNEAKEKGIMDILEKDYTSAIHVDSTKAVFKTEAEQDKMAEVYQQLIQDFGKFLSEKQFVWKNVTKSFNRIYFNTDGSVDYFVYSFRFWDDNSVKLTDEEQAMFKKLLNEFIQDYKIPMSADKKFAQCSPVTYMPKKK